MNTYPLSLPEQAQYGYTHRVRITYLDFALMAASPGTLAIFPETGTALKGIEVKGAAMRVVTQGAHASTLTLSIGDPTTGVAANMAAKDLKGAADVFYPGAAARTILATGENVNITVTSGATTPSAATAGEWDIYLNICDLNKLRVN